MEPMFNLKRVKEMLRVPLTEEFISVTLGIPPTTIVKRSRFYTSSQVNEIVNALIEHLKEAQRGIGK